MQLRTAQGIRDSEKEIAEMVAKERSRIGKQIEVSVEWGSFINDPKFEALPLDNKTSIFRNIVGQHVHSILSSSYG